jgi:hypothetical protein
MTVGLKDKNWSSKRSRPTCHRCSTATELCLAKIATDPKFVEGAGGERVEGPLLFFMLVIQSREQAMQGCAWHFGSGCYGSTVLLGALIYATRRLVMLAAIAEIIGPEALQNLWVWTHCWHIARIANSLLLLRGRTT